MQLEVNSMLEPLRLAYTKYHKTLATRETLHTSQHFYSNMPKLP